MRLFLFIFMASTQVFATDGDYKKLSPQCRSCNAIDSILTNHNSELSPDKRIALALKVAAEIKKIAIKNKPVLEQRREIYYALNGAIQVLPDDFDSQTVVHLMDLRAQSKAAFDHVYWRFPQLQQQKIWERMRFLKFAKVREKAELPDVKVIED